MSNFQDSEQYLKLMESDKKQHIKIISFFAQLKKYYFENEKQMQGFISRTTRAAKALECYDMERIKKVAEHLSKTANYKWTLETVLKFIDEDIDSLNGQEPIMILPTGERVYTIQRLKELESDNKIYWNGHKWLPR